MKHRVAVLGAFAIGLMIAFLMVGRVRAAEPARWIPPAHASFQYQLSGEPLDTSVDADIFDVDLESTTKAEIAALHGLGRHVLCYVDAGSYEPYRSDSGRFPASVKGKVVDGWPDERWLDIRRLDILKPILRDRLDRCAAKGFDGVEYDWVDGYVQDTGFPLTRADQLRYDRWLARAAHARGLAAALKNGPGLVRTLVDGWDLSVVEQCFQYRECGRYLPFVTAGKPVLDVEYSLGRAAFCDRAATLGITAIRKHLALDPWRAAC
ncbi:MAG: endo alpha-1,4 polygalactosaminidase [Chloroflexota bacterium]